MPTSCRSRSIALLLAMIAPVLAEEPRTVTIEVAAKQAWTKTGVVLEPGMSVRIEASGAVEAAGAADGRAFYHQVPPEGRREMFGYLPCPLLPAMGLVGRIGEGATVHVGAGIERWRAGPPYGTGELLLGINDDRLDDNSGAWRVRITVFAAGAPPSPNEDGPGAKPPEKPSEKPLRPGVPVLVSDGPVITNGRGEPKFPPGFEVSESGFTFTREVDGKRVTNSMSWSVPPRKVQHGDRLTLVITSTSNPGGPYLAGSFHPSFAVGNALQGENSASSNAGWRQQSPHRGEFSFEVAPHGGGEIRIQAGYVGADGGPGSGVVVVWKYRQLD